MKYGFSLVELSIVLVILGLLTGGILAGQNLIRAAELRSVTTEYDRYIAAVNTFRDKYFAIPGDMRNATDFWGIAAGSTGADTTCYAATGAGTATCNGNGNGRIGDDGVTRHERFHAWKHLANAGLIEGSYTGVGGGTGSGGLIGENVPRAKLGNGGWYIRTCCGAGTDSTPGNATAFAGDYGNMFDFGTEVVNNSTQGAIISPEEAWNIDTKIDDGLPGQGKVVPNFWAPCTLAASQTDTAAEYELTNSDTACSLFFRRAF